MISVDPIETADSSRTGKKSKGDEGEEEVIPDIKEIAKSEAVGAGSLHRPEE